ncbi:MAG: hypothetical protein KIT61_01865 [Pyrinomonadaceae bacterium]|nr:hypothetical protein [Pyrinomonadaceae bacterium]
MKNRSIRFALLLFVFASFTALSVGQTALVSTSGGGKSNLSGTLLPLSEIKEGMKGTARTVFRGSEPEEFNVEILGVVPGGIGPRQDLIVGKISGGEADRTAVFAGMSGSPVYINGKLIGAISYSFPFSKEAICGITPIEQMIDIFELKQPTRSIAREPRTVSFSELASADWLMGLPRSPAANGVLSGVPSNSALMTVAGQTFQRIATPVTFTGLSQETLNYFAPQLLQAGLLPVAASGGSASMTPMKPADAKTLLGGASVSMQLTRGDYSLAAAGTVTLRDGDKVYAFGHPFLSLGSSDLPMSESHVVAVVPNINNSFKLAVPDAMVGSMTQDRATGVFGNLGRAPAMIPVRLNINTSRGGTETLNFEVARDEFLTPLLLNITIFNSITAQERSLGDTTISLTGEVRVKGQDPIRIERRFAGSQSAPMASGSIIGPVGTLLRSRFDDLKIEGISIDLTSEDGMKLAALDRLSIDRSKVRAGETVEVQAFARTSAGKIFVQKIPFTIPAETPVGLFTITVGDGGQIQQNSTIQQFVPRDISELIRMINKLKSSDRLYVQASRSSVGAVIGASELPNLPPSVLATINNDRITGGVKPTIQTVVFESILPPSDFLISGQQSLSVEVVK